MSKLVTLAASIAEINHAGQENPFGEGSYFDVHLVPVAGIAKRLGYEEETQATAFLHDILEDTDVTSEELLDVGIPFPVVDAVQCLTKVVGESQRRYLKKVMSNPRSHVAKYCDSLFNLGWTTLNSPNLPDDKFREWTLEYQGNLAVLRQSLPKPPFIFNNATYPN